MKKNKPFNILFQQKMAFRISVILVLFISLFLPKKVNAQELDNEAVYKKWLENLYETGIVMTGDSLIVSEETKRIMNDPEYRKLIYPEVYTWEQTIILIQQNDLKKAFWYLINLYGYSEKNKALVLKTLITYDKLLIMEDVLQSTFIMYAMHDKVLEQNSNQSFDPHASEEKAKNLKEILFYLAKYRTLVNTKSDHSKTP